MKLVLLHPSDELYGADRVLVAVAEALQHNHQVEVWLPIDVEYREHKLCRRLDASGIPARHLAMPVLRRRRLTPRGVLRIALEMVPLLIALRRAAPSVVWVNTAALAPSVVLARLVRARVVVHIHEIPKPREGKLLDWMLTPANRLLCVSEASRGSFSSNVRRRARVLANAVPGPDEVPMDRPTDGPLRLLYIGRWSRRKGIRQLIEAIAPIDESVARLTILGSCPMTGDAVDVPSVAAAAGAAVSIVGEVDDVTPYLNESDLLVVPSTEPDPSPLVVREAAAWGRPAIATATGGLLELVEDGETGWIVPPGNVAALTDLIGGLTRDETVRRGKAARNRWEREWRPEAFATAVRAVAESLRPSSAAGNP